MLSPETMSQPSGSLLCGEGAGRLRSRHSCAGDTTIGADLWQVLRKYLLSEVLIEWRPLPAVAGGSVRLTCVRGYGRLKDEMTSRLDPKG